jgi:Uma2 family endonuclease
MRGRYPDHMGQPAQVITYDEYLALDDASEEPLEYVNGEIVAVGGATRKHNRVVGNVWGVLDRLLKGRPCVALAGSQRVHIPTTNMGAHPDVVVLCGKAESDKDGRTLLNPSLIVEVLSPTTDDYDRGAKFRHYMRIPSFVEYLVVSPEVMHVEHHRRIEAGQWLMREFTQADDQIEILKTGATMRVGDLYDRVDEVD